MNTLKTLLVIAALSLSSLAMAEGGSERTLARMQPTAAVATQVAQQQKAEIKMNKADHTTC
jgi:predicted permease